MHQVLESFSNQIHQGYHLGSEVSLPKNPAAVIICGVGGSAIPGKILLNYLSNIPFPIILHTTFDIPPLAMSKTPVICISYSGNTEETVSSFQAAWRKGCPLVVITSGGKLLELAKQKRIPTVELPFGCPPLLAYGYQFFSLLKIFENSSLIENQKKEMESAAASFSKLDLIKSRADDFLPLLKSAIPLVYTSQSLSAVGSKWKINFNEIAKVHAFANILPEASHNEIMGFRQSQSSYFAFFLKDEKERRVVNASIDAYKQLVRDSGINTAEINLTGGSYLATAFSSIALGDWIAYLLAKEKGVEPFNVSIAGTSKRRTKKD